MNILKKLTIQNLKMNKKRSIGTVIGIILSVALICAVAGMFASFQATLVENAKNETGYYHFSLGDIPEVEIDNLKLNKDIKSIHKFYKLGYSKFEHEHLESDWPYIQVYSSTKEDAEALMMKVIEGRFPKSSDEIVISSRVLKKSNYKVGDYIELDLGKRMTSDGEYELHNSNPYHKDMEMIVNPVHKKYKIVGVVSKYSWDGTYFGVTTLENNDNIDAYISLKDPGDYKKTIPMMMGAKDIIEVGEIVQEKGYKCSLNNELLRWEIFKFSDSTLTMLYSVAAVVIVIIIITSVFCIRNSFAISTLEKMKMYGMLASVGATKKQIKKSVIYEGLVLGMIGIPIGVLSGIFADFVLVKVVNLLIGDYLFRNIEGIVFKISIIPIVIAIILGFLTIYLSSIFSAIKASKVSPIENLRNSNEVKMNSRKLKTPIWISKIFKTGGDLAYKNLKRSKKKYRTTVVSLTVSIMIFISMNAFINETFVESMNYYTDYDYNVGISGSSEFNDEYLKEIRKLDNVDEMFSVYESYDSFIITDSSKILKYEDSPEDDEISYMYVIGLDDSTFKSYAKKLKLSYEEVKDKGILVDDFRYYSEETKSEKRKERYNYKKGEIIQGKFNSEENKKKYDITIGAITKVKPYGFENTYYGGGYLVLNTDYYKDVELYLRNVYIQSGDSEKLVADIAKINADINATDFNEMAREEKAMLLVISIFLYGFIVVITLIGVTNIFNTITANMELRSKEFAMLKSIGMTKKEFNRMVNLETLFYSTKSLLYGIILGLVGAFLVHKAFAVKSAGAFPIPYVAILISIVFVFIIVSLIMKYSIHKINKLNTIETIRNENI